MEGLIAHRGATLIGRQDLPLLPTPEGTATHKPIPHAEIVGTLVESLGYRHLEVVSDQYAVTPDGMRMFGVLVVNVETASVRLALGVRNSHDKSFSLALTVGYKVFVCDNLAFFGDFTPVIRKHTRRFDPVEVIDGAVGKMQRNFEPLKRQIDAWQAHELPDDRARLVIYRAFVEGELDAPKHLARNVHDQYFHPSVPEFAARTFWSLSNAFTSAFKCLDAVPQFRATAKLGGFLGGLA